MRSFVAIDIGEEIRREISSLTSSLKRTQADVKWVNVQGMHLTLKFLGEIETEKMLPSIETIVSDVVSRHSSFIIGVRGTGVFPDPRRPRVLWVGIEENKSLSLLQQDVEKNLAGLGFDEEKREFKPHLTIGRVRSNNNLSPALAELDKQKDRFFGKANVDRLILFESILKPQGAEYRAIREFKLR